MSSRYQSVGDSYKWTAHLLATAITLAVTMEAQAQTAPAASTVPDPKSQPTPAAAEEEVIELTPFEVSADKQEGYLATSSLAGTRLNTSLKDVASAITVVTPQFMKDTGATDIARLLVYTTNTESSGLGGNYLAGSDADSINRSLSEPQRATRVRGLANADITRDFFLTDIGLDSYNIENVDIQRGPNSILFGLGSPAGIINSNLKAPNLNKTKFGTEFRIGKNSKRRATGDADISLIKDELGIRIVALDQTQKFDQRFKFDNQQRHYLSARWQPKFGQGVFTQFTVNYEAGRSNANRPQPAPPRDAVTPFWETNKEVNTNVNRQWWDTYHQNFIGLGSNWWDNVGVVYSDPNSNAKGVGGIFEGMRNRGNLAQVDGGSTSWADWNSLKFNGENIDGSHPLGKKATFANNPYLTAAITEYEKSGKTFNGFGGWGAFRIMDPNIFDFYGSDLEGPNAAQSNRFDAINATARQTYLDNTIGWEVTYSKEDSRTTWASALDGTGGVGIEINGFHRDGTANPNLGRAYFITKPRGNITNKDREAFRATAFYKADFKRIIGSNNVAARILGESTFTGVASSQRSEYLSRDYQQYRLKPNVYRATTDIWGINYLTADARPLGKATDLHATGLTAIHRPNKTLKFYAERPQGVTDRYFTNEVQSLDNGGIANLYTNADAGRDITQNRSFVWQGKMLFDTVYPLFGWRKDSFSGLKKPAIGGNDSAFRSAANEGVIDPYDPDWTFNYRATRTGHNSASERRVDAKNKTYGAMFALPEVVRKHLPYDTDIRFGYNKSSNFNPTSASTDVYGRQIPPSSGQTKDYTLIIDTLNGRLNARVTWYKTSQKDVEYGLPGGGERVFEGVQRFMNGMMKEIYTDSGQWVGNAPNYLTGQFSTNVGIRRQATPEWLINEWFFGKGTNWKTDSVANTPIDSDWVNQKSTLINQPLRIRAAALDPSYLAAFRSFGSDWTSDAVQNNAPAEAWQPPLTVDELNYRLWWFVNQPDSRWYGPLGAEVANGLGLTRSYSAENKWGFWNYDKRSFRTVSDRVSKGVEIEITANPTKNWRVTFNAAKTEAVASNIAKDFDTFIQKYNSVWTYGWDSSQSGKFISYWDRDGWADSDTWGMTNTEDFGQYMNQETISRLETAKAAEGKSLDQIRKWRWNVISSYDVTSGILKGLTVGGALRWEDKGIIGYGPKYLSKQDVWISDLNRPYTAKATTNLDLWFGYTRKLDRGIDWNIQLNLYNVGQKRRLVATAAQPDGSIREARIADGLSWELTTGFKF